MARIVCLSDTHGLHDQVTVPTGDLLIHAGDHCNYGTSGEVKRFDKWLGSQNHPHKLLIAGNHDWPWHKRPRYARLWLHHARYLQDQSIDCLGFKVYGSPWQPEFCNWAFNLPRDGSDLERIWSLIPDDTEILITHTPPAGILDHPEAQGCALLRRRIEQLRHLRLHVFGHIHAAYGQLCREGTIFVNASICDESYRPNRAPIEINLHKHVSD
ncbi:metallophosphatase domain-containing protein [bacterium]|nr:metallophosphatase domain-containing protein [bacterium]